MSHVADGLFALAVAMGVSGLAVDGMVGLMPEPQTEDFFDVHSFAAERVGNTAVIKIDRTIHQPLTQGFVVRVLRNAIDGKEEWCVAESLPFEYLPDAKMPATITLDWWTRGQCKTLPPGPATIITTWTPVSPRGLLPVTARADVTD